MPSTFKINKNSKYSTQEWLKHSNILHWDCRTTWLLIKQPIISTRPSLCDRHVCTCLVSLVCWQYTIWPILLCREEDQEDTPRESTWTSWENVPEWKSMEIQSFISRIYENKSTLKWKGPTALKIKNDDTCRQKLTLLMVVWPVLVFVKSKSVTVYG